MRRLLRGLLFLGLAALPAQAYAQYPPYYYQRPVPMYGPVYPYGYPAMPVPAPWQYGARPVLVQPATAPQSDPYPGSEHPAGVTAVAPVTSTAPAQVLPVGPGLSNAPIVSAPGGSSVETLIPLPSAPSAQLAPVTALPARSAPTILETVTPQADAPIVSSPDILPPAKDAKPGLFSGFNLPSLSKLTGLVKDSKAVPVVEPAPVLSDACAPGCATCKPCKPACVLVFGEYLYWNVHGADVPFAQAFDGTDPFTSVPRGPVASTIPHWETGYRGGVGVAVNDASWLVATFTYFHEVATAGISAPDGDVLHNSLVFPNTVNSAGDSLNSNANYVLLLETGDLDYKCAFINSDHLTLSWLAGGRYAHLQQALDNTSSIFGTTLVRSHIDFDGFGPRCGLEGEYKICHGIYGYGKAVANLLVGEFKGTYEEDNIFTGLVGQTAIHSSRVVPVTELELGVGWQSAKGHVRVSAGYYIGSWFNAVTTTGLASAIGSNSFNTNGDNFRDNFSFDGIVGRLEFRY